MRRIPATPILVAAGTYNENVNVNVDGLTITAVGNVTVHGTFKSDNGIADGDVAPFPPDAQLLRRGGSRRQDLRETT